jgi:myo-inositol catabolism protein IolC
VVLGRGQGENTIRKWLTLAGEVADFIGFAVGRTDFRQRLAIWRAKGGTREAAVKTIARRYRELVEIFEKARPN